jgi:GntR family transcriptional regulator
MKNPALDQSLLATRTETGLGNRAGSRRRLLPQQARDAIAAAVRAERLEVGAKLPSEFVLAERLGVSRSTIREAMKLLEQDGVVEVRRGTGSFVSVEAQLEPERPITQFESITSMMRALGHEITTVVLEVKLRKATAVERAALGLRAGKNVVETRRLREHEGSTCIYSVNVLDSSALADDVEEIDWSGSVVALLDRSGQAIVASTAHIRAVDGPEPEDELPGLSLPNGPWLLVSERCVTREGRCVLTARDYHHGAMFTFSVLRRRQDGLLISGSGERGRSGNLLGSHSPNSGSRSSSEERDGRST